MKSMCYLILLLLFSLFSAESTFAAGAAPQQEQAEWTEGREDVHRLAAILRACQVADVLQQNSPFGSRLQFRRYPHAAPSFFKEAVRWSSLPVVPEGKNFVCRNYNRYLIQKKEAGYYIYALRKIII